MSEVMDRGILMMPFDMAMHDELSRRQFYDRAQTVFAELTAMRDAAQAAEPPAQVSGDVAAEREALVHDIASIIDHPSVYMGGPSRNALRQANAIADALIAQGWRRGGEDYRRGQEDMRERAAADAKVTWYDGPAECSSSYMADAIRALPIKENDDDA